MLMTSSPTSETLAKRRELSKQFIEAIEEYQRSAINSRGLAHRAEKITTAEEIESFDDELLSHSFWAMRHLLHQPACWAAKPDELFYLVRCLRGEEDFDQTVADSFRVE